MSINTYCESFPQKTNTFANDRYVNRQANVKYIATICLNQKNKSLFQRISLMFYKFLKFFFVRRNKRRTKAKSINDVVAKVFCKTAIEINETKFFRKISIDNINFDDNVTCDDEKKIIYDDIIFGESTTKNEKFEINFRDTKTTNFCSKNTFDNNDLNKKKFLKFYSTTII